MLSLGKQQKQIRVMAVHVVPEFLQIARSVPEAETGAVLVGPAADGAAAADRQGGGERLDQRDDRPDPAAVVVDGVDHFGDAASLGFRGEVLHQVGDAGGPGNRNQDDQRSPGARRGVDIGIVDPAQPSEEQHVVDETVQAAENDRSESGDSADRDRQKREDQGVERFLLRLAVAFVHGLPFRFLPLKKPSLPES